MKSNFTGSSSADGMFSNRNNDDVVPLGTLGGPVRTMRGIQNCIAVGCRGVLKLHSITKNGPTDHWICSDCGRVFTKSLVARINES